MQKRGYTYIMTNKNHTTLYVGVTNNLLRRTHEHKNHRNPNSFTARYNVEKLVWFVEFTSIKAAIEHEKYLKGKKRSVKLQLINELNPEWNDLVYLLN